MKRLKGFFATTKKVVMSFLDDNCLNVAASIVYFVLQSIIPLVLGVIVVASFVLQQNSEARDSFIKGVKDALPTSGVDMGKVINDLSTSAPGLLSVTGILLLWSGSSIFESLIFGVNIAYGVTKDKRNFFKKIGLRFGLLFLLGAIIGASFAVTAISSIILNANIEFAGIKPGNLSFILPIVSYLIPIALMFCVFSVLYKLGPDRKGVKWRPVFIGALVAAILFEVLKNAFAFYVTAFNAADSYAKTYGALGGILLFLFYMWLSAAVMLLGAEVAAVVGGWKEVPPTSPAPASGAKVEGEPETATAEAQNQPATVGAMRLETATASGHSSSRPAGPRTAKNLVLGSAVVGIAMLLSVFIKPKEPKV